MIDLIEKEAGNPNPDIAFLKDFEVNSIATELENIVLSTDATLDINKEYQLSESIAEYTTRLQSLVIASGSINSYVLEQRDNLKLPPILKAGMRFSFIPNSNNTGATTIEIGSYGVKDLKQPNGNALTANMLNVVNEAIMLYDGVDFILTNPNATGQYFKQQIILSNNLTDPNNDIDFSAGNFVFHDNTDFANLSAITKRLDANWVVGTNQGGLDTGSKQINTWYYCYAIYNPTTQVSDVVFSANNTSPTLPSGFTKYKYIRALRTDGAGNILQGIWNKDGYFEYNTPIIDFTGSITTSRVARTLTAKPNSRALINVDYSSTLPAGTISSLYLSDLNKADNSIVRLSANIQYKTSGEFQMQTNSSSQIGTRTNNANNTIQISTIGFYDLDL